MGKADDGNSKAEEPRDDTSSQQTSSLSTVDQSEGAAQRNRIALRTPGSRSGTFQTIDTGSNELGLVFVESRSQVHLEQIREAGRIKRLTLIVSSLCFVVGALIAVFAPAGKETLGYIIGGSLIVLAAGAAGFGWVRAKTPLVEVAAGREKQS